MKDIHTRTYYKNNPGNAVYNSKKVNVTYSTNNRALVNIQKFNGIPYIQTTIEVY